MIILVALSFIVIIVTSFLWIFTLFFSSNEQHNGDVQSISIVRIFISVILSFLISYSGYKRKSLSYSGTCFAFVVGFLMTVSSYTFMTCMLMFFISSSKITKWRVHIKKRIEHDFKEGGQRNWVQVVCNGGVATQLALIHLIEVTNTGRHDAPINFLQHYMCSWLNVAVVASIACSCGDTFSSEVGSVVGRRCPRLITTFQRVPRGTNGAISVAGLLASLIGGLLIGLTCFFSIFFFSTEDAWRIAPIQWPIIFIGAFAGLAGSILDSVLGATFQYSGVDRRTGFVVDYQSPEVDHISGRPYLNNHSVNLISSLLISLSTPYFAFFLWKFLQS